MSYKLKDCPTYTAIKEMIEHVTELEKRAIFSILYGTGCRVGELNQIKAKHCSFEQFETHNVFLIKIFTEKNPVQETRICPINPVKEEWIVKPITDFAQLKGENDLLFPYSTRWLNKLSHKFFAFNPHAFRHIRATHLKIQGYSNSQLKQFFGWSSDRPLWVYDHLNWKDLIPSIMKGG